MSDQLVIDVATRAGGDAGLTVVVEPVYGVPAVALALDAGWGSVEVAGETGESIPLVSFEQPPAPDQRGGRCRVRSTDLSVVAPTVGVGVTTLLGAPVFARPLASRIAAAGELARVTFVAVPAGEDVMSVDGWWAAGMLIRVLLEELDDRPTTLTDAAGIAVTLAQGAEDPASQLSAGVRWRRHLERGGHADDLRVASAVDSVGVVPRLDIEDGAIIARPWLPGA
jgi:phosphosulfolactate phosphohydrolase-like enzyme